MNKLTKKTALMLGTIAAVGAPIAAVISCGGSDVGRFDQANDGVIKIMTGFSKGGTQERALQAQIAKYNSTNPKMKVQINRVEGGYGAETSTLVTKFNSRDTKTLPNLVVGYGDTLGSIAKYNMQFDLEKSGTTTTLRSRFEDKFMAENDNISGIDGSKGTYIIPLAKSTEVNNINKEVIGYILTQLKNKGATITGTKLNAIIAEVADPSDKAEQAKVKDIWGPANSTAATMTIDDSIFETYTKMIDFATKAQLAFGKAIKSKELHILGIDSPANLMYEMSYARLGNKELAAKNAFLFVKATSGKNAGYLDHPWAQANTVEGKALQEVYDLLKPGLENGALMINGAGAYSSQTEVKHMVGMAIGSTAGYSHNYVKGASAEFKYATTSNGNPVTVTMDYTDQLKVSGNTYTFSSYNTKLTLDGKDTGSKYDITLDPTKDKTKVDKITALIKAAGTNDILAVSSNANAANVVGAIQLTSGKNAKYLISTKSDPKFTGTVVSQDDTLQENELQLELAPGTWDGQTSKSIFSQGPSIIGVHSNTAEDEGARDFVDWLTSKNEAGTSDARKYTSLEAIPVAEFNKEAGYIDVLKGAFANGAPNSFSAAQKMAYKGFQAATSTSGYRIFTNPIDDTTATIRKNFEAVMIQEYEIRANGKNNISHVLDLKDLYSSLKHDANI